MTNNENTEPGRTPEAKPWQFGLPAAMWTTFVIGLSLAYLRTLGEYSVFSNGVLAIAGAAMLGIVVGSCCGRIKDATYWSLMITTAAYLSVAGDKTSGSAFHFAWASVGAAAGCVSGAAAASRMKTRIIGASLAAGAVMLSFSAAFPGHVDMVFDLISAPLIGGLVGVLVQIILWVESNSNSPRYVTASWLLLSVIGGNLLVPVVLP